MSHKDLYCRKCNIQFEDREELDKHLFSGLDSRHLPKPPAPPAECKQCGRADHQSKDCAFEWMTGDEQNHKVPPKSEVREWLCKDTKGNLVATIDKLAYLALEAELARMNRECISLFLHDQRMAALEKELEQVKAENAAWPERFLAESDALRDLLTAANERARELISDVDRIMRDPVYTSQIAIAAWEKALLKYKGGG